MSKFEREQSAPVPEQKSPLETIIEIENSLHPPLPEPPEDATWIGKATEEMTEKEILDSWEFLKGNLLIIANRPQIKPDVDHPRYHEYMQAKREYESWFQISPETLLKRFTI